MRVVSDRRLDAPLMLGYPSTAPPGVRIDAARLFLIFSESEMPPANNNGHFAKPERTFPKTSGLWQCAGGAVLVVLSVMLSPGST
jgi:hypothetical protein